MNEAIVFLVLAAIGVVGYGVYWFIQQWKNRYKIPVERGELIEKIVLDNPYAPKRAKAWASTIIMGADVFYQKLNSRASCEIACFDVFWLVTTLIYEKVPVEVFMPLQQNLTGEIINGLSSLYHIPEEDLQIVFAERMQLYIALGEEIIHPRFVAQAAAQTVLYLIRDEQNEPVFISVLNDINADGKIPRFLVNMMNNHIKTTSDIISTMKNQCVSFYKNYESTKK